MSNTLDKEMLEVITACRASLEQGKTMGEQIKTILAWGAETGRIGDIEKAVKQLETQFKGMTDTLESKMAFHRRRMHDERGNYRGVFGSEETARAFGLVLLSHPMIGGNARCAEALKSEFPDVHAKAMNSTSDSAIINTEFSSRMLSLFEQYGLFEQRAFPMPMGTGSGTFLREAGDVTVYCEDEGVAPTASDIAPEKINLVPKRWVALSYYSRELDEDAAVSVANLLARAFARGFAKKMDTIGFVGAANATSFGIAGLTQRLLTVNTVAPSAGGGLILGSGNAWSELTLANHEKVVGALPQYAAQNARWYCSRPYFFNVVVPLVLAGGGVTAMEIQGKRELALLGHPVDLTQVMVQSEANSQVPILLGDIESSSTIGRRAELEVRQSEHYKFAEGQITVLARRRVAVVNHDVGSSTVAGPVVGLLTAAS